MSDEPTKPGLPRFSETTPGIHPAPSFDAPIIEGFRIVEKLGEGGMGTVWRAIQLSTKREVALKLINPAFLGSEKVRNRFEREVELASRLKHPHIAHVYESGVRQQVYCYAMELVEGFPLDRFVEDGKLSHLQILELMKSVCLAIQYAHQQGVIHTDLKPSNILVTHDGQPHVLDFGLAKSLQESNSGISLPNLVAGTLYFMSPEQARGERQNLDTRSDVYSLGVILYRLLTGQFTHAFTGDLEHDRQLIINEEVNRPRSNGEFLDRELEVLLRTALAAERDRRYSSAQALAEDIANYLEGHPLKAKEPTTAYVLGKWVRRHRTPVAVGSGVAAMLLSMAVYSYVRISHEKSSAVAAKNEAELRRATGLISEGGALLAVSRWEKAKSCYTEARGIFQRNRMPLLDADIAIWDLYRRFPLPLNWYEGQLASTKVVCFVPSGGQIVSGTSAGGVTIWDVLTGQAIYTSACTASVISAISPDAKALLISGSDDTLTIRDARSGSEIRSLIGHAGAIHCAAWSPNGDIILTGGDDKSARIWNAATGREVRSYTGHSHPVLAVAFSPDGRFAASSGKDRSIRLWQVNTGHDLPPFTGHRGAVRSIVFSPDGRRLISGSDDRTVRIWEVTSGTELKALVGRDREIWAIACSHNGLLAASGGKDGIISVWNLETGNEINTFVWNDGPISALAFSPDDTLLVSGGADTAIRLWPVFPSREFRTITAGSNSVSAVVLSRDHLLLAGVSSDTQTNLWDCETGRELGSAGQYKGDWETRNTDTGRSGHEPQLARSAGSDPTPMQLAELTREWQRRYEVEAMTCESVASDGSALLTGSDSGRIYIWEFSRAAQYLEYETGLSVARRNLTSAAKAPDALVTLGEWYAFRGMWSWAIELLERARKTGAHGVPSLTLGRCYLATANPAAARKEFENALARNEASGDYLRAVLATFEHGATTSSAPAARESSANKGHQ
jgi:WD40 repeat protein